MPIQEQDPFLREEANRKAVIDILDLVEGGLTLQTATRQVANSLKSMPLPPSRSSVIACLAAWRAQQAMEEIDYLRLGLNND